MPQFYHAVQLPLFPSKICRECGILKSLDEFYKDRNYYGPVCKICICRSLRSPSTKNAPHRKQTPFQLPSKVCRKCNEKKLLDEFPRHSQGADGHLNMCKECRSNYRREYERENPHIPREQQRRYRAANLEKSRAWQRRSQARHADKRRTYKHSYYIANHEKVAQAQREYKEKNYETIRVKANARSKEWHKTHPARHAEATRRRTARKHNAAISNEMVNYDRILERDGPVCHICEQAILPHHKLHFDHVIPLCRGGSHTEENIKPSHGICNNRKASKLLSEMTPFQRRGPS